jgi:hypothetical protein
MVDHSNLVDAYFDDAARINAVCAEEDLPDSYARLFTYIHVRAYESGKGLGYFDTPQPEAADAIRIMLGEKQLSLPLPPGEKHYDGPAGFMISMDKHIAAIDSRASTEHGIETPLSSELRLRLRLYEDATFRDHVLQLYRERIAPFEKDYSWDRVRSAFRDYRMKKARREQETMRMMESAD